MVSILIYIGRQSTFKTFYTYKGFYTTVNKTLKNKKDADLKYIDYITRFQQAIGTLV